MKITSEWCFLCKLGTYCVC